jgi:phospholipid-binding lipoprotein MlaA
MRHKSLKLIICTLLVAGLMGCATNSVSSNSDPLESWNRKVFTFNNAVDEAVAKPVAKAYVKITPSWTRAGISNFFNNLSDAWSVVNNLIQGQGVYASENFSRVLVNSSLGIFGLLDLGSYLNIERHTTNFSITLGHWGVESGPYFVFPLLGPMTLRDMVALPLDSQGTLFAYMNDVPRTSFYLASLNLINKRSYYLGSEKFLSSIVLDKYSFMRDAYLQRQQNLVDEGKQDESTDRIPASLSESVAPWTDWFRAGKIITY